MKTGQIWSGKNSKSGEVRGFKVEMVMRTSPMGRPGDITHMALMSFVKEPRLTFYVILDSVGRPLLGDGTPAEGWFLVEDVP